MQRQQRGARLTATSAALLRAVLLLASLSWAPALRAQADPQQKAAAEALFDEGRRLMQQGQYESACRRFQQSQEIDRGVGTLLYLGECYERSGKLASAWAIFREAASAARAAGQGDRARIADERARRLAPTLSKLALLVPDANRIGGFELLLDGRLLSEALFGVPFPVDAGAHELTARAPGRAAWSSIVEIKGNADYRSVQIPALDPVADSFAAAGSGTSPSRTDGTPRDTGARGAEPRIAGQRLTGLVVAGAGVLSVGTGVIFGVMAKSEDDDAKEFCAETCPTREAAEKNEDARTSALIANVAYGVGAAALVTGAILYFTADDESSASALRIAPQLGTNGNGFSISGGF